MKITVSGEQKECSNNLSILELLNEFGVDKERVAVELNSQIIPRAELDKRRLKEGDRLEIVTFVGGG